MPNEVWLIEFRRRYIKGDKFQPDFIIGRKGGESSADYARRAQETAKGKNIRALNFDYRAKRYVREANHG